MSAATITTTTRRVHFAISEVSAVFVVPRKTESEALTLFYQPEDCDRFRAEAELEKLAMELSMETLAISNRKVPAMAGTCNNNTNIESLNALTQLARHQFKAMPILPGACVSSMAPHRSRPAVKKGTARIA